MILKDISRTPVCSRLCLNHLFEKPLCEEQSVRRRIANIVFHVLTLGIPFLFYHAISYFYPKAKNALNHILNQLFGFSSLSIFDYAKLIDFANQKLSGKCKNNYFDWSRDDTRGIFLNVSRFCLSKDLDRLIAVYWNECFKRFQLVISQNPNNPWMNREVLEAADELFKLSCSILILTIQDIKQLHLDLKTENKEYLFQERLKRTHLRELTVDQQMGYRQDQAKVTIYVRTPRSTNSKEAFVRISDWDCSRSMFYFRYIYTFLRIGIEWDLNSHDFKLPQDINYINYIVKSNFECPDDEGTDSMNTDMGILSGYKDVTLTNCRPEFFYQGTYQYKWRELYNKCCGYMKNFFSESGDPSNLYLLTPPRDDNADEFIACRNALNRILR